jgi:glyoxylase-like metal-dependent hydrolase (beta-lactamase superfamily II)
MALLGLLFSAPAKADAPWDPDDVTLVAHELGDGVYAVLPDDAFEKDHVATTAGFVIGDDRVLLVEAMVSRDLTEQLLALVRHETDLPIRYVVNTSYHGDHSYGNYLLSDEVAVIQHPATADYITSSFEDDRSFMLDLMGAGKGIEEVQPRAADLLVEQMLEIDLGGKTVEIRHFGFAQTPGDLVIWVPDEKVLWVGNMLQAPPPALPWLLEGRHRETIATLSAVRDFLPLDATIIPGHGHPMSRDEIDFSIRYLQDLDDAVSSAVHEGLSLDETREEVAMDAYRAYSLFEWAHRTVNVPAAYEVITRRNGPAVDGGASPEEEFNDD